MPIDILIEKDSATRIPKQVADLDEARAFAANGFAVHVIGEDGTASPLDAPAAEEAPGPTPAPEPVKAAAKKIAKAPAAPKAPTRSKAR